MYIGSHWLNSNETGDKKYLNATNLNKIENAIEGALGKRMDIPYYWAVNTKEIENCSGTGWEVGSWDNTSGIIGFDAYGQWCAYTNQYDGQHFVFSSIKNLTVSECNIPFDLSEDYIRFFYHISVQGLSYMNASSSLRLIFANDIEGTLTNYFYYDMSKSSLLGNDTNNEYKILFNSFNSVGSPVWTAITGIAIQLIGTSPSSAFGHHLDAIHVCRSDKLNPSCANAMQRIHSWSGGDFYPEFTVENEDYQSFVGYGYSEGDLRMFNLTRNLAGKRVKNGLKVQVNPFVDGIFFCRFYAGTTNNTNTFSYYVDANNYIMAYVEGGVFTLVKVVSGSSSSQTVAVSTITLNTTIVEIKMWKEANNYMVHLYLNDNEDVFWALATVADIGHTGSFYIGNDIATTCNPCHYTHVEFSAI